MLYMRPRRPICFFIALAGAKVMPWSHNLLFHPETLVFELSQLG